ncbi:MAG: flavodoxin family protein [Clostridia bacterium]|nr:flavodoxin family protein [Clostridia bacterium]
MKVLLINGSPNAKGCTYTALKEVADKLNEHGIETEIYQVGKKPVAGCIACRTCFKTGKCVFDDGVNTLNARAEEFDAVIVGAPVYYAGPAGQACAFLDRLFYSSRGKWAGKPAAAVVSCRRGGASAAYDRLNKYFTIGNMPVVSANYWNQVHGNNPEEVKQDLEGMQTMRVLGENMAYLLKCLKAAKEAGVPAPVYEPRVFTNFIR